jgi:hypothetical protein
MATVPHLVLVLGFTALARRLWPRPEARGPAAVLAAGALAALPALLSLLGAQLQLLVSGKEGLLEIVTEALLLTVLVRAAQTRQLWLAVGAAAVFLEEVDYGQWITRAPTPQWLADAGSRSGNLNTHNLPVAGALWRLGPLSAAALLGLRDSWPQPLGRLADRLDLPRLHRAVAPALLVVLLAGAVAWALLGNHVADESGELAAVLVVALGWRATESPPSAPDRPEDAHP